MRSLRGKSYELVCGESLCEVRLHVFAINLEFFSPFLHSWILPWWSERYLDLLCTFEERIRALTRA